MEVRSGNSERKVSIWERILQFWLAKPLIVGPKLPAIAPSRYVIGWSHSLTARRKAFLDAGLAEVPVRWRLISVVFLAVVPTFQLSDVSFERRCIARSNSRSGLTRLPPVGADHAVQMRT
jgi:hypothetical protein